MQEREGCGMMEGMVEDLYSAPILLPDLTDTLRMNKPPDSSDRNYRAGTYRGIPYTSISS